MIHPSYVELMKVVNHDVEIGEEPVVNSRYSIVSATARRARQIIDGSEPLIDTDYDSKPLSIAVEELDSGALRILTDEEAKAAAEKLGILRGRKAEADALAKKAEEEAAEDTKAEKEESEEEDTEE